MRIVRVVKAISLRLMFGVLSLLFISLVTFIAGAYSQGDAAALQAGDKASPEAVARIRHLMGLDRPWPVRYVEYLNNAAHGDFGKSLTGTKEPVVDVIGRTLPVTLQVASLAIIVATVIGLLLGTVSGIYRNKVPDRAILTISTLGVTLPNFVLAQVLTYIFVTKLDRLPLTWKLDRPEGDLVYLILPVVVLSARSAALITRLTRQSMIDTLQQEFIRMAVAKGVPRLGIYIKHALRNAILPVITAIGTSFGVLLTGSFAVEIAFTIPGIGSTTIDAIKSNNMPVVQACVMVTGTMFLVLNLIVDILLPILDPRVRESQI